MADRIVIYSQTIKIRSVETWIKYWRFAKMQIPAGSSRWAGSAVLLLTIMITVVLFSGCMTGPPQDGSKPDAPGIVVEYKRTGGIAGFQDQMVVFGNGEVVYARKDTAGTFTVPAETVEGLRDLLENADFPALAPHYPAPSPGADYFSYSITYREKTVTTETGGVPPPLEPVIMRLDALLTGQA